MKSNSPKKNSIDDDYRISIDDEPDDLSEMFPNAESKEDIDEELEHFM